MLKSLIVFGFFATTLFSEAVVLVGIAGGTGSGKTTLAEKIHGICPESVLISQDSYYKDLSHLSFEEREFVNFDHPEALEFSLLREDLLKLKNGEPVEKPVYNFHRHAREQTTEKVDSAKIVLVEGILLFAACEVRDLFDLKIFVDTDDDIRILRRIERDIKERSRDFEGVKNQYLLSVKPMHEAFVAPSRKYADLIIPGMQDNSVAVNLILSRLKEFL